MVYLSLSVVAIGLTNIIGMQVLTPLNKDKFVLISVMVGAVVDFVLNFFWIPAYGATGAALSTLVCEFAVLAVQVFFAIKLLKQVKLSLIHIFIAIFISVHFDGRHIFSSVAINSMLNYFVVKFILCKDN